MIFRAPTLDKGHPDGAHLGQLVDCLKAMVDRLREKSGKLLVVEDLEAAAGGDLAHGGRVEPEGWARISWFLEKITVFYFSHTQSALNI